MTATRSSIQVHVLLFAAHREVLGCNRLDLDLAEGATVEDVFRNLSDMSPAFAELRAFTSFAVNREIVPPETPLQPGDEVALLQPVSGGARD